MPSSCEAIAQTIREAGGTVIPNFYSAADCAALRTELRHAWAAGAMHRAAVGQGSGREIRDEIRRDHVLWLDPAAATAAQQAYFSRMNELRMAINQQTFMGLFELESHFTVYPPETFYRKHLDRFHNDSARAVSCILYLNENWVANDGGQLRLYLDEGGEGEFLDVLPHEGTLVIFLSNRFWHEVLPARRERLSLTGWFKTRS